MLAGLGFKAGEADKREKWTYSHVSRKLIAQNKAFVTNEFNKLLYVRNVTNRMWVGLKYSGGFWARCGGWVVQKTAEISKKESEAAQE